MTSPSTDSCIGNPDSSGRHLKLDGFELNTPVKNPFVNLV